MSETTQLFCALGYCLFMLLLAWVVKRYPPKRINQLYGYRTNRSMKNQEIWDEANRYSASLMYRLCLYCLLIPGLGYAIFPDNNFLVTIVINTLLIVSIIYYTEKHLNLHFDKEGNRKGSSH